MDYGVKIKYLTLVTYDHVKSDVVTEIPQALKKLTIPLKLIISLEMDGQTVNKSILNKLTQIKMRKAINTQTSVHQVVWFIFVTIVSSKELQSMAIILNDCV